MFEFFMHDRFYKDKDKWFIFYRNPKFKDFKEFENYVLIKAGHLSPKCFILCCDENDELLKKWLYLINIRYGMRYGAIDFNVELGLFDDRLDSMHIFTFENQDEKKIKKLCRKHYIKPNYFYKKID